MRARALLIPALLALHALPARGAPLRDVPIVWHEDDRRDIPAPLERDPNMAWTSADDAFFRPAGRLFHPGRLVRGLVGRAATGAANVNALDEVPNSSWFTNRLGLYELSPEEMARGPVTGPGPDAGGPWTVVKAKTEGVTPGFTIEDAQGVRYLLKFDDPRFPGMASASGVITGRILHAAGYNVPEDHAVTFPRERLVLGDRVVHLTDASGARRPMTAADLDTILTRVPRNAEGNFRALASRFLSGAPLGPIDYLGRRDDDPNDRVPHEDRRELRGLRVFCAWLAHYDTKQQNTLDMFVEEGGRHFVRHHLIDFASTLGGGATGPFPAYNFEYSVDLSAMGGKALALGFHEDAWRDLARPDSLPEVGYFENTYFDPLEWKPLIPNAAFANLTDRDAYWACKIISAFTDDHLRALVATGRYQDPAAEAWILRGLIARRDRVLRTWFTRVPPLDFFIADGDLVRYRDLGRDRGVFPGTAPRYQWRARVVDADRHGSPWTGWTVDMDTRMTIPASGLARHPEWTDGAHGFVDLEVQVDRGEGWSASVHAFVSRSGRGVIAVER